jgi:hypothetical protein
MATYTLLELVQQIASSTGSDDITSINDSTESLQIANIVRRAYFDLIKRADIPEHFSLSQLASTSVSTPTIMTISDSVCELKWIKYNKILSATDQDRWTLVTPLPTDVFFERMHLLDTDETNVDTFTLTVDGYSQDIYLRNDKQPDFYTTFNDSTIIFDSYNINLETYLASGNTQCYGKNTAIFTLSDSFTPDIDEEHFTLLLNEATSLAWLELKQAPHPIAERNSRRGWTHLQRTKHGIPLESAFDKLPYFGRR